ncbi:MAG: hypothetical protein FWH01_16010 [Oscillospiraceae bacterium]|nr:hypothetical protein [Oscillospiraceae bacterium]
MEWKDKYPKKSKPAYNDLLDFFQPQIRELFLRFDQEMREQFNVRNKYHRYLPSAGWSYGYGRSYNCELLAVTVKEDCFNVLGISITDKDSLRAALEKAKIAYDGEKNFGYEERYAAICAKKRADQIARSKRRVSREKAEMEKLIENTDPGKLNQFKWCKKVTRNDLYRLYQGESKGLIDEALLDDIGLTFYMRCKQAKEVRECMDKGQIICHHCGAILTGGRVSPTGSVLTKNTDNYIPIVCGCGYSYTYREYRRNCNSVNMPGGRAAPIFDNFLHKWPGCRDAKSKMLLIDWLVHECHVTLMSGAKGRSVCVNLIEGSLKQISDLLEKLYSQ